MKYYYFKTTKGLITKEEHLTKIKSKTIASNIYCFITLNFSEFSVFCIFLHFEIFLIKMYVFRLVKFILLLKVVLTLKFILTNYIIL